jgi:RHS repeat-associated protein
LLAGDHKQTLGRRKKRAGTYKYKFLGNEFQDELGLNVYDYDNRVYDQAVGRFWQMDPLAEQGRRWSPYNYCFDNPVYFQDPDGMWPKLPSWNDVKKSYSEAKSTVSRTYNQTKASVTKTYNEAKTSLAQAKDNVVKTAKDSYKSVEKYATDNKKELLKTADDIQKTGDVLVYSGTAGAVVGSAFAGVGAAPGLAVATEGAIIGGVGELLEISVEFLTNDKDTAKDAGVYVASELLNVAVDKALPGPTPDLINAKEILQATTIAKGTVVGNAIKEEKKEEKKGGQ